MATSLDKFFTDNDNDYTDYSDTDPDIGDPFPQMAAPWQPRPGLFPPDYDNQRAPAAYSYGPESTLQQTKQIAQKNRQGQYPKPQPQPQTGNASSPSEGLTILSKGTSQSLMGGMQKMWESGEYSDLTIQCEDQTLLVHKVVVCSQSKVLATMMKKGFKESELNIIDLSDNGVLLVSHLMKFLYTGNYVGMIDTSNVRDPFAVNEGNKEYFHHSSIMHRRRAQRSCIVSLPIPFEHSSNLKEGDAGPKTLPDYPKPLPDYTLHVEMYTLSDQFDIANLGVLARAKLEATCLLNWNSASFLEIIPRVYESTLESNQGLRTVVLEYSRKHANDFMKDDLLKASFQSVLASTPEFSAALLNDYMMLDHGVTSSTVSADKPVVCADCGERKDGWHHNCQSVNLNAPDRVSWFP